MAVVELVRLHPPQRHCGNLSGQLLGRSEFRQEPEWVPTWAIGFANASRPNRSSPSPAAHSHQCPWAPCWQPVATHNQDTRGGA
eukprot:3819350-Amphidinium_carterae.1